MFVKQLSVFLENRVQSLNEVLSALNKNGINMTALSLADATDYGMLRLLVSDPDKGQAVLKEVGFSAKITEVICLKISNETGALDKALSYLSEAEIGIEYVYAFADGNNALAVLKLSDPAKGAEILKKNNFA